MAKELYYDDVNFIMDGLRNLGSKRRRRSVAATVGALFGQASFGSSIFNTAQLHLNEDRQRIKENQQFLMEELLDHNLRINNITRFVEDQYRGWVKQVKLLQDTQRRAAVVEMGQQIHLLIQAFRMELTDFLTCVTQLMDHHLSPLLVSQKPWKKPSERLRTQLDSGFAITHLPL